MDHLPLPVDPAIGTIRVPFLCTEKYDSGEFADYASRHGWVMVGGSAALGFLRNGTRPSVPEIGAFLQTWLYFGLIYTFTFELPDLELYQTRDESGVAYLTTRDLSRLVGNYSVRMIEEDWESSPGVLQKWSDKVYECFLKAREIVMGTKVSTKHPDIDLICMSVAVLGEYLLNALKGVFIRKDLTEESPISQSWRILDEIDCGDPILMKIKKTWCPSDIARLDGGEIAYVSTLWYLANLKPPKDNHTHTSCSATCCEVLNVRKETYAMAHAKDDCRCALVRPREGELAAALGERTLPLLRVGHEDGRLQLSVQPSDYDQDFIAISHIWSDGRGNPSGNALPECIMHDLARMVNDLPGSHAQTPFWIDTICVPRHPPELRKTALLRLKEPYERARGVLVLDSSLQKRTARGVSAIELVARVKVSTWMQRLWTFQEGRLCRRVWFQFQDGPVDLLEALDTWRESFSCIPSLPSDLVDFQIMLSYMGSKISPYQQRNEDTKSLLHVRLALCSRSTSDLDDEALCIATIMGIPLDPIVKAPKHERMPVLWSTMPGIPLGLVFSKTSRKLDRKGLRWAPASLMGDLNNKWWGGPVALSGAFGAFDATLSNQGLVVSFPGLLFSSNHMQSKAYAKTLNGILCSSASTKEILYFSDEHGGFYHCQLEEDWHQTSNFEQSLEQRLSIILARSKSFSKASHGKHAFDSEWIFEGILVPHPNPASSLSPLYAKAHRHVMIEKHGKIKGELALNLKRFVDDVGTERDDLACDEGDASGHAQSVLKDRLRHFLDGNEETAKLALQVERNYYPDKTSGIGERILRYCLETVEILRASWPLLEVQETDGSIQWCVD